jgi:hypothetical protein
MAAPKIRLTKEKATYLATLYGKAMAVEGKPIKHKNRFECVGESGEDCLP